MSIELHHDIVTMFLYTVQLAIYRLNKCENTRSPQLLGTTKEKECLDALYTLQVRMSISAQLASGHMVQP